MKKAIFVLAGFLVFANVSYAANDLGSLSESIAVGKTISIGLNLSPSGSWYIMGNTAPGVARASIQNGSLIIAGTSTGTSTVTACVDVQSSHCLSAVVTVGGNVLGEAITAHPAGSWVLDHGTVYYITDSGVLPITTWSIFLSNGGKQNLIQLANEADLNLPLLSFMTAHDSRVQ